MQLLETLVIPYGKASRTIELYHGDLTELPPEQAVDLLVVSAFRGDYTPTPGSLIGALDQKGISVAELANHKAVDLREMASCWLSSEIRNPPPGVQFERLLCFEPEEPEQATMLVGDIFRCLVPVISAQIERTSVAMPIVGSGDMGLPAHEMLEALLDAATHWMTLGLPLHILKIVVYSAEQVRPVRETFVRWRATHGVPDLTPTHTHRYDVFISYSHKNKDEVDLLVAELKQRHPKLRIFLDRFELNPGAAWQQQIYEALDDCHKVIAIYSPDYLTSRMCKEEFNIAIFRERKLDKRLLFPILLYDADLPSYMATIQYEDCRQGDEQRLRQASTKFLDHFMKTA